MNTEATVDRRRFLVVAAGAAMASGLPARVNAAGRKRGSGGPGSQSLEVVPFVGEGSFPVEKTVGAGLGRRRSLDLSTLTPQSLVTPADRFFIRTGCPVRLPPAASWSIRLHGLVEAPLEIPIEELRRKATDQGLHLLECAGNSRNAHFGLMSCARFRGVSLEHVLGRVRILPRATQVLVSGVDEHDTLDPGSVAGASWIFTPDQLLEAGAFLATEMNGAPLRPDHGHPVRLVVPGWYACAAIKWVNEIVVVDDTALPTTHMLEYAGRTHQEPSGPSLARDFAPATVDPAAAAVRVERLADPRGAVSYRIVGLLWGAPRLRSLRIRLGPDRGFEPVEKVVDDATAPWTLWSHTVPTLPPGRHRIELAASDPALRTRRLDQGFYARAIEIAAD